MITKTEFKDAVKKTIIYTIMSKPERIYDIGTDEDGAMQLLVYFYKRIIKKLYEEREELKSRNDINELYDISFECLFETGGEIPNYIIYQENMLFLESIHTLYGILGDMIDGCYCEIESDIDDLLKDVE